MIIDLSTLNPLTRQNYLQHAIAPRPICFASTINSKGEVNLSPFSFFNLFSTTPAILVFSPVRRVRDNTTKHTLENVLEVPEVGVNIVDYNMVQQASLASCEYPREVNEFEKAGFTPEAPLIIRPPLVRESLVKMECRVLEIKSLGELGGSGSLVICEILNMHINEEILDNTGMIDQQKLHHVARLGGDWYCRVGEDNLFKVPKPNRDLGIGVDALPWDIRNSRVLTGNDLGMLANVNSLPDIDPAFEDPSVKKIIQYYALNPDDMEKELHIYAKQLLADNRVNEAWQVLLTTE